MASKYDNLKIQSFESINSIEQKREDKRRAREIILHQAKRKYEKDQAKKEEAARLGEGTWMLDSVSERISREEKDLKQAPKKKHKKEKKKKKKKKKSHDSSSDDSQDDEWVEKTDSTRQSQDSQQKGPHLQRESWMEMPLDQMPLTSRQEVQAAMEKEKKDAAEREAALAKPGIHAKELNPYWRDGGTGLPQQSSGGTSTYKPSTGDGGLSWLRAALARFKRQASDEGKDLEEIVAERWGSLRKLQKMIKEAEQSQLQSKKGGRSSADERDRERWRREDRSHDSKRNLDNERLTDSKHKGEVSRRSQFLRPNEDDDNSHRHTDRDRRYEHGRATDRHTESSYSRSRFVKPSDDQPSQSPHFDQNNYSRKHRHNNSSDDENRRSSSQKSRFVKPRDDRSSSSSPERDSYRDRYQSDKDKKLKDGNRRLDDRRSASSRSAFARPASDEECAASPREGSRSARSGFMRPSEDRSEQSPDRPGHRHHRDHRGHRDRRDNNREAPRWKKKPASRSPSPDERKTKRLKRKPSVSSCDSSSDSDSCQSQQAPPTPPPPPEKLMTEEELNDLAAKILRAEIMGDDVSELQAKLQSARERREAAKSGNAGNAGDAALPDFSCQKPSRCAPRAGQGVEEEDNVVVLTRTGKGGMTQPLAGTEDREDWGGAGGKRRRKKNVKTHDVSGSRTQYFDDDLNFDLKTLVEKEKSGTAEDQNKMFARLASRSKPDRDMDVDDMFVDKAARKQNEAETFSKDRAAAIFEHRKLNAAMEKCHRCFDKVPKHLIVAIGSKSYLCLPAHRSLTEGHCFIVPMQHCASATSLDEDVWREMQQFRKSLVQMYSANDQDVVIMETVMHLKHFPHTALECVPLDQEVGDLSPIYFKKAIQEVGPEWSDNKKLVDISKKDIRHSIPKGFPYFAVDFGLQGGFATVIEDEQTFPSYFGTEIVGGMIDAEPNLWRKPHKENFENQKQKVLQFEQRWREFDWTQNI